MSSHVPFVRVHALTQGAVTFHVIDNFDGEGVRGDYMGEYPGVVRPMVNWTTQVQEGAEAGGVPLGAVSTA